MAVLNGTQLEERTSRVLDAQRQFAQRRTNEENLAALSRADIERALKNESDPFITQFAWGLSATPGGLLTGSVFVEFPAPDAVPAEPNLYLHVWVGPANITPEVGGFLLNVDPRFRRLTAPKWPGLCPGMNQDPNTGPSKPFVAPVPLAHSN